MELDTVATTLVPVLDVDLEISYPVSPAMLLHLTLTLVPLVDTEGLLTFFRVVAEAVLYWFES